MNGKITRTATAMAVLAVAPVAAIAQSPESSVTIYGRLDTSLDSTKTGPASQVQMRDNASRLGLRGVEDMGGGLKGVFGLEFGYAADSGTMGTPAFRNSYVGLAGGFGGVALGRLDSANPTGSPIYSLVTRHTEFVIHDAGAPAIGTAVLNARNRVSNAIGYQSPDFGNVLFRARYYMNGEGLAEGGTGPLRFESDLRSLDVSVSYGEKGGPLGIGVAYGKNDRHNGQAVNEFKDKWMVVGAYDFGVVRAWAVAGRDNFRGGPTSRSAVDFRLVGASVDVGGAGSKVIANYMTRDVQADRAGTLRKAQVGYAHKMSKRTMLFALYDRQDPNSRLPNDTVRNVSVGIQHNF